MALTPYQQLEQEFRRLHAFRGALSLLRWDAAVMMPRGSADVRGEQLAALETEHHALLTTPKVARLIERAEAGASQLDDWPLANLREMRRQRDHAIATPPSLIARLAKATARAEVFWVEARKANDFKLFAPHLEEVVHLVRDKAALLGQARGLAPYDALVEVFTPGISTADIDTIFKALSRKLPGLIHAAIELQAPAPRIADDGQVQRRPAAPGRRGSPEGDGLPVRPRPPRRERASVHGRRSRRHARDHALRRRGSVHGPARRRARDRACVVRPRLAAAMARSAGRPRPRSRARGEPVAAVRDEPLPQPRVRRLPAAAAREIPASLRSRMAGRQSLPAFDPRAPQPHPHGRGRTDLSRAHHAALRTREENPRRRAPGRRSAGSVEREPR